VRPKTWENFVIGPRIVYFSKIEKRKPADPDPRTLNLLLEPTVSDHSGPQLGGLFMDEFFIGI
jgi:hypothetical protein